MLNDHDLSKLSLSKFFAYIEVTFLEIYRLLNIHILHSLRYYVMLIGWLLLFEHCWCVLGLESI